MPKLASLSYASLRAEQAVVGATHVSALGVPVCVVSLSLHYMTLNTQQKQSLKDKDCIYEIGNI